MIKENIILISPSRSGHNFIMNLIKEWSSETAVWRFENVTTDRYEVTKRRRIELGKTINFDLKTQHIFVARDLLNWFASMLMYEAKRNNHGNENRMIWLISVWKDITTEGLGLTNIIPEPKMLVFYDKFKDSKKYREGVCGVIGGEYSETLIDKIPEAGNYSSFDGKEYQDRGSQMETSKRFLQVLDSDYAEVYKKYLRGNQGVLRLYLDHFETTKEQKAFLNTLIK